MANDRKYTALCGLYCLDCIPSNQAFFEAVGALRDMLSELNFGIYARLKAKTQPVFEDYPVFDEVLAGIETLACPAPCTDGGCKPDCKVRRCVGRKNYEGCWECAQHHTCRLLEPLKNYHGKTIDHNLEMIKERGLDNWSDKRGKHYTWL